MPLLQTAIASDENISIHANSSCPLFIKGEEFTSLFKRSMSKFNYVLLSHHYQINNEENNSCYGGYNADKVKLPEFLFEDKTSKECIYFEAKFLPYLNVGSAVSHIAPIASTSCHLNTSTNTLARLTNFQSIIFYFTIFLLLI
jgi:hypothetical protein